MSLHTVFPGARTTHANAPSLKNMGNGNVEVWKTIIEHWSRFVRWDADSLVLNFRPVRLHIANPGLVIGCINITRITVIKTKLLLWDIWSVHRMLFVIVEVVQHLSSSKDLVWRQSRMRLVMLLCCLQVILVRTWLWAPQSANVLH